MTKEQIAFIHRSNDNVVETAKAIIIGRISILVSLFFKRTLEFKKKKTIRLDKLDLDMDVTIPKDFQPLFLTVEKEKVCLHYREIEYDPICPGEYLFIDNLEDLTLTDCQHILYAIEEEF